MGAARAVATGPAAAPPLAVAPAPPGGAEPVFLDCSPELASAARDGHAYFHHVALAYQFGHRPPAPGQSTQADRELCRRLFPPLLAGFERRHGHICRAYFAAHVFAAAALTDRDEVGLLIGGGDSGVADPACVRLLLRAQQLGYAAWHRLHRYDRRQCQRMIFSVILEVLRRLDVPPAPPRAPAGVDGAGDRGAPPGHPVLGDEVQRLLERQLDDAEDFLLRCATRRTQIRYLRGMLVGLAGLGLALGVTCLAMLALGHLGPIPGRLMIAALAGGVGAVASVAMRMSSPSLQMNLPSLSQDDRDTSVRLIAGMRPLLGAVIGVVTFLVFAGGLMHVTLAGADPATATMTHAALAFLSGFSERLAQDVFVRSGQGIMGAFGDTPSRGPSAGLAPPPGSAGAPPARAGSAAGPQDVAAT